MVRGNGTPLKQRILDEARRVLEKEGVSALSTRRLAKAVGCTATSLYLYFDNKEALLHVLMEEGFVNLGQKLEAPSEIKDGATRVRSLARAYLEFGLANPAWYELMFLLPAERLGSPYPPDKYRAGRRHLERLSKALIGTGSVPAGPEGSDPQGSVDRRAMTEATLLWSSLHGLVSLLLAGRVDTSIDQQQLIEAALDRVLPTPHHHQAPEAIPATGPPDLPS